MKQLEKILFAGVMTGFLLLMASCKRGEATSEGPPLDTNAPQLAVTNAPPEPPPPPRPEPSPRPGGPQPQPVWSEYNMEVMMSTSPNPHPRATAKEKTSSNTDFDSIYAQLRQAQIAFQAPTQMDYGDNTVVRLLLSEVLSGSALAGSLTNGGGVTTNSVKVADVMEAHLVGQDFNISPITPEVMPISAQLTTQWQWQIAPTNTGNLPLHLSLDAHVTIDGTERTYSIKTFDETVYVHVTLSSRIKNFIENNWQWLWTTLLAPALLYLWHRRRKRRP